MLSDAEYELEREVGTLRAALIRERRARELRSEVAQLAAATSEETDRAGVAQTIADGCAAIFDAGWSIVAFSSDDDIAEIRFGPGMPEDVATDWAIIPIDTPVPLCDVLRGEVSEVVLPDLAAFEPWPMLAAEADRARMGSFVVRRFETSGSSAAAIGLGWPDAHTLHHTERELLDLLIRSVSGAFDRSSRTEVDAEFARVLQQWVLDNVASCIDGVDIESVYEAGNDLLSVGGDWFDVIDLDAGRVAAVVGDVVGHDARAAVEMSQVRHVLAAHLVAGHDGPAALDLTDAYLRRRTERVMATALVIMFEGDGTVSVSSAGHPRPIVDRPGVGCGQLDAGVGPPLGSGLGRHDSAVSDLPPGSTVVAYTDGVVEERGQSVDEGIEALADALATAVTEAAEHGRPVASSVAAMLRARITSVDLDDDTAALVLHVRPDAD